MQGSLAEFRLAEVLQLVAVQQKTGLLRLVRGKQLVTFYFDHGVLVACRDRRHQVNDPLLDYLGRTGFLQPDMVQYLHDKLQTTKEDLVDLLVGERFLSEEELLGALEDLAQELVHQTFTWREGTYQFIGGEEALEGLRYRQALKIEAVLMEGARRADEWPRLREKLPGPDVVLDAVSAPPTTLGPRTHHLLSQITEVMRLGDLVQRARLPEFETYEIIAQAADAGLVRILEKPEPPRPRAEPEAAPEPPVHAPAHHARRSRLWTLPRPLGWTLAVLLSLVSLLGAHLLAPRLSDLRMHETMRALQAEEARDRLRLELEVYRALHGRYPAALEDLAQDDLASASLLRRAAPMRYTVTADGSSCLLARPTSRQRPGE